MARFSLKSFFGRSDGTLAPLRFNSWAAGGRGAALFEKSAEALELERMNPLRGVDEWRLGQIFDDARDGIFADLAWLYNEIEGVEPALMSCCETRESAAGEMGWVVRTADAERTHGFDEALAGEQRAALLEAYGVVADDLPELAGHMVTAFFRGAAHAQPLWNADGTLAGFRPLDLWNFALDRGSGLWYWNADASRDESAFQAVPPGELVTLAAARHVDHAALPIFIRAALGAKRYGVWLDRFGIPPVGVIMPPSAERGEQGAYMELARKFARGGSGVLPNGSQVTYGTEARAVCPFPDFIRFQQQQIYAVGIGRVQSGETDGSNLGGNAAGVVDAALSRIVRRDARRIARALNDCVTRRILGRLFPGRPVLAQFAWDTEAKRTGREALEEAGLARNAGLEIDRAQLEEMTGYTLRPAPQAPAPGGFGLPNSGAGAGMPDSGLAKPLQNARKPGEAQDTPPEPAPALKRVLAAFRSDLGPAAEELRKVLDLPEAEMRAACKDLAGRLPDLLPKDPAMAAVIAEELAGVFTEAVGETGAVENGECRAKDPAHCPVHGTPAQGGGSGESEKAKKKREKRERQEKNRDAGRTNYATVQGGADCRDFMRSETLGRIGFYQGNEREGYLHIVKRAGEDAGHAEMLKGNNIPDTLAYGKYYRDTYKGTSAWAVVGSGGKCVILGEDGDGVKIITAFILSPAKQAVFAGKKAIENAEVEAP